MSVKERKSYKNLCEQREAILDEAELWKKGLSSYSGKQRLGLWTTSTYLDELMYIRQSIEKDIMPYLIHFQTRFYKYLEKYKNIPTDIILNIASFGDLIDQDAVYFISKGEFNSWY